MCSNFIFLRILQKDLLDFYVVHRAEKVPHSHLHHKVPLKCLFRINVILDIQSFVMITKKGNIHERFIIIHNREGRMGGSQEMREWEIIGEQKRKTKHTIKGQYLKIKENWWIQPYCAFSLCLCYWAQRNFRNV